ALIVVFEMPLFHALRGRAHLPVAAAGALCIGLAWLWLVFASWGTAAVVAAVLTLTLGEMLYSPFLAAHVSERAPAQARGTYLGACFASLSVAFVLAPLFGGEIYDRFGPDALWCGCFCCCLVAALGLLLLCRTGPAR